jgi:hypothetical protein
MESLMYFFDESVRQRQQKRLDVSSSLTDSAENLLLEFAKSKQNKMDVEEEKKFKAFFEECMDNALHCRGEKAITSLH